MPALCVQPVLAQVADEGASPVEETRGLIEAAMRPFGSQSDYPVLTGWSGFVQLEPRVYLRDRGGAKEDQRFVIESELLFELDFSERIAGVFRPRAYFDVLDGDLSRFEPYEAYVTLDGEAWDVRLGQIIERWGFADLRSPLDLLNRFDFATDPLVPDRLGELGLVVGHLFEGGDVLSSPSLSVFALPVFRETRFGPSGQRIGPGPATSPAFDATVSVFELPFDEEEGFEPDGTEAALLALGGKSALDLPFAAADAQLLVSRGPSRTPAFAQQAGEVVPVYYGAATVGLALRAQPAEEVFGTSLSELGITLEAAHTTTYGFDDAPIRPPGDYLAYVVGVDRRFEGLFGSADLLDVAVEYAGETGDDEPADLSRTFRDDLVLRGRYVADDPDRQTLELRTIFDLDVGETIVELVYGRRLQAIHEDLSMSLQVQVFDPADPGESFYGSLEDLSSVALALRWQL